ncbi:DC1, C1-like protein [Artemisia annua]|uniref:DC1, C1-like protein n=1 Tax=Artemisia annua TaxID=35608 RepID=A0A2U1K9Y4_ARTAN|nr:DC1, C1-like protein [Artemisia annua]
MDIICATTSEQKINRPGHPHQLERMVGKIVTRCAACSDKHEGNFFHCTTCLGYRIHVDCALLPAKLLIQQCTNETFTHSHPLTLSYSFPYFDQKHRFLPFCRVCDGRFNFHLWLYSCDKCRYYVHVDCATSKRDAFMSILLQSNLGKTSKNYKDDEHPNLLHCPFSDESDNLLKHQYFNQNDVIVKHDGEILNHPSHQYPLNLFNTQTSLANEVVSLHDPMKKIQLLCDGCVKPITTVPFYKCSQSNQHCDFILHEWCAKLPPEVKDYVGHPEHKLVFWPKVPSKLRDRYCKACMFTMFQRAGYYCPSCDIYIHAGCALLLPGVIRHKYDKHPLSLRYEPAENHISEYFCDICENEFNPWQWFYHCTTCDQSMHAACAPLILQCEQATYSLSYNAYIFKFLNVKFGKTVEIKGHSHRLAAFVQGIESHGNCIKCRGRLQYKMIFKCLECKFAFHHKCAESYVELEDEAS